jgi:hypothetical protein
MSAEENFPIPEDPDEFADAIREVEIALDRLKHRYRQITEAKQERTELEQGFTSKELEYRENPLPPLETELQQIREQIQELDIILESDLLKNDELRRMFWEGIRQGLLGEVFWQIVRFGGIGVLLGWVLKSCTG